MNTPRDPLQKLLQRWEVSDELPSGFRREVWRRVEATRGFSWRELLNTLLAPIPMPVFAAIALLLALGAGWAGRATAKAEKANVIHEMAQAYLDSVDPEARAIKS